MRFRWTRATAPAAPAPPVPYLSRRPIFDRDLKVTGYELVALGSPEPADEAAVLRFGLDHLVGGGTAHMAVSPRFVVGGRHRELPRHRVVLQMPGTSRATFDLRSAVETAEADGYMVALDDFDPDDGPWPLVSHVHVVRLNPVAVEHHALRETVASLRSSRTQPLATPVEVREVFDECRAAGFDLFEGFFFQRPEVQAEGLTPDRQAVVRLLAEPDDPAAVRREIGLTRRVLTGVQGKPPELVTSALVRARMCEELADELKSAPPDAAFVVGLVSMLDALLDVPLDDVLKQLALPEEQEAALLHRDGPLGAVLAAAERYERGDVAGDRDDLLPLSRLTACYLSAVRWTDSLERGTPGN